MENFGQIPSAPERKIADGIELETLFQEEEGALFPEGGTSPKKRLIAKALCAITLATALFSGAVAQAAEHKGAGGSHGNVESSQGFEHTRSGELRAYMESLHIKWLTLGKVKDPIRLACEQYGVYFKGIHIGDIYAGEAGSFSVESFKEKVSAVVDSQQVQTEELMDSWGAKLENGAVHGLKDENGKEEELQFDSNTVKVNVVRVDASTIIIYVFNKDKTEDRATVVNGVVISVESNIRSK